MRVALYARVSTRNKQEEESQLRELRRFARAHKWKITKEYIDKISGASVLAHMPAQTQLFEDAARREFDRVIVFELSRFLRGGIAETFKRIERLKTSGIDFWSLTQEHFRTTGPAGEFFIATSAFMANLEREELRRRVQSGVDRAREEGTRLGRPPARYDARTIKAMKASGLSIDEITVGTGLSRATVYNRLNAPEAPVGNVA